MFSAPLQSALATNSHDEHTYNPRSTRFDLAPAHHFLRRSLTTAVGVLSLREFESCKPQSAQSSD